MRLSTSLHRRVEGRRRGLQFMSSVSRPMSPAIEEAISGMKFGGYVRWLVVDSEEFRQLFRVDRQSDREQWNQLQQKWVAHA